MLDSNLVVIGIFLVAAVVILDYALLCRRATSERRKTLKEHCRDQPEAYTYLSGVLSRLSENDSELLTLYLYTNIPVPCTNLELLDLIDQHITWQSIADGRAGTIGNPSAEAVIQLEKLYNNVLKVVGPVAGTRRETLGQAAQVALSNSLPNPSINTDATR